MWCSYPTNVNQSGIFTPNYQKLSFLQATVGSVSNICQRETSKSVRVTTTIRGKQQRSDYFEHL